MCRAQYARRAANAVANRIGSASKHRNCAHAYYCRRRRIRPQTTANICAAYRDCAIAYCRRCRIRPQTHRRAQATAHICANADSYTHIYPRAVAYTRANPYGYTCANTNAYTYTRAHAHRCAVIYKPHGHHRRRGV